MATKTKWIPVEGFNGAYEVNKHGNVRSYKGPYGTIRRRPKLLQTFGRGGGVSGRRPSYNLYHEGRRTYKYQSSLIEYFKDWIRNDSKQV